MSKILLIVMSALLMTSQAQALCVSRPETADSKYVANGVSRSLCLNRELSDTTNQIDYNAQFGTLRTDIDRMMIDQKFDNLNNLNNNRPTF